MHRHHDSFTVFSYIILLNNNFVVKFVFVVVVFVCVCVCVPILPLLKESTLILVFFLRCTFSRKPS